MRFTAGNRMSRCRVEKWVRWEDGGCAHCLLSRLEAAVVVLAVAQPPNRRRRSNEGAAWRGNKRAPEWTNRNPGTPAQITMLIVVVDLSAHTPLACFEQPQPLRQPLPPRDPPRWACYFSIGSPAPSSIAIRSNRAIYILQAMSGLRY